MDTLTHFNQQILRCQDDAYTLAWYLLGDEAEAEAVLQKAVEAAYHCFESRQINCHLLILKQVVNQWRERKPVTCGSLGADIFDNQQIVIQQELVVLILIDILRLSYPEASIITGIPLRKIGPLLARARQQKKD